jgi:hypothetical protein
VTLVGFFDDKAADAAAHGVKPPKKKDMEAEFKDFQVTSSPCLLAGRHTCEMCILVHWCCSSLLGVSA